MNEIERDVQKSNYWILYYGTWVLSVILIWTVYTKITSEVPETISRSISIAASLKYFEGNKHDSEGFYFKSTAHQCEFVISGNALEIILEDPERERLVSQFDRNDVLEIRFRKELDSLLNDDQQQIAIRGLSTKEKNFIREEEILRKDDQDFLIICIVLTTLIVIGLFLIFLSNLAVQ